MASRSNKSTFVSPRNRGRKQTVSNTDTQLKIDAGGGQMEQVRAELGLGAYAAGVGVTAAIGAGIAAARSLRVVRGVSDAAKNEQRVLSNMQRQISGKDLGKIQGLKKGDQSEILMQRYQNYYDDAISPQIGIKMQREAVSNVMKSTAGKLRVVKRARGGGKNKK